VVTVFGETFEPYITTRGLAYLLAAACHWY
jgi:hypothetical protein